jgi:hypothetical protein
MLDKCEMLSVFEMSLPLYLTCLLQDYRMTMEGRWLGTPHWPYYNIIDKKVLQTSLVGVNRHALL